MHLVFNMQECTPPREPGRQKCKGGGKGPDSWGPTLVLRLPRYETGAPHSGCELLEQEETPAVIRLPLLTGEETETSVCALGAGGSDHPSVAQAIGSRGRN